LLAWSAISASFALFFWGVLVREETPEVTRDKEDEDFSAIREGDKLALTGRTGEVLSSLFGGGTLAGSLRGNFSVGGVAWPGWLMGVSGK